MWGEYSQPLLSADVCNRSGFSWGSSPIFIILPAVSISLEVNVKSATKNGIMFVITRHEYVARATTDLSVSKKHKLWVHIVTVHECLLYT